MKSIKLLNLKLTNFKGAKEFDLNASGGDLSAFGDNGTYKTTLFDAFIWVLFDTDSLNRSTREMGIKTLDENGEVIHKLNHEVEISLLIGDKEVALKKVYREKWGKVKGSMTDTFTGHTTDHFINSVPSKAGEYEDFIKGVVDKDVFKLLTSPSYFNEQLHWTKQRDLLLEVAGDVDDSDVIASNEDLAELEQALNGNSIEDHQKIIAAKRRAINEEVKKIPIRIDEIHRNLPDITGLKEKDIKDSMAKLLDQTDKKHEQINSINNGSEVNELKRKISDIELQLSSVRNEHTQNEQEELFKLKTRLQEEQSNRQIMRNDLASQNQNLKSIDNKIKDNEEAMVGLREDYASIDEGEFTGEHHCPTCSQSLPEDHIEEARTNFNLNKSKELESINAKGVELKEEVEQLQDDKEKTEKEVAKITENGKKKASDIEKLEGNIKKAESTVKPIEENEQYIKLNDEKKALDEQIKQLEQSVSESVQKVQEEIRALKEQQSALQADLSKLNQHEESKERITELEVQEKTLAAEFEQLEKELHLTEEFTRTKVNMLTDNINSKFKYARFNLFKENINGGLEETCETKFEGVPYGAGLNNAARINIGLDIINTLSKHYGVQAPIFVDNAESITRLIDVESQVISLVVSESDKKLRVESKSQDESEVA